MATIDVSIESHVGEVKDALPEQIEQALTAIGMTAIILRRIANGQQMRSNAIIDRRAFTSRLETKQKH